MFTECLSEYQECLEAIKTGKIVINRDGQQVLVRMNSKLRKGVVKFVNAFEALYG